MDKRELVARRLVETMGDDEVEQIADKMGITEDMARRDLEERLAKVERALEEISRKLDEMSGAANNMGFPPVMYGTGSLPRLHNGEPIIMGAIKHLMMQ